MSVNIIFRIAAVGILVTILVQVLKQFRKMTNRLF